VQASGHGVLLLLLLSKTEAVHQPRTVMGVALPCWATFPSSCHGGPSRQVSAKGEHKPRR